MATTTNYGWTTPDDTALVKDGASAIRTLGSSVDTTTKNLNPETTLGDISFRSSTSNVNTRLGIGGTGTVLTVAGGLPSWAAPASGGGMTVLTSGSITNATLSITSIDQTYNNLMLYLNMSNGSAGAYMTDIRFNSNSSAIYNSVRLALLNGAVNTTVTAAATELRISPDFFFTLTSFQTIMNIYQYTNTDPRKIVDYITVGSDQTSDAPLTASSTSMFRNTAAITSIQSTSALTGSFILYGVK